MKLFRLLCVLALVLVASTMAYAETQSVKVSGDIALRSFARGDYDLDADDIEANAGTESNDWATYLLNTAEVQVDADLTDNVGGTIRLINQRVWGDDNFDSDAAGELQTVTANGQTLARATNGAGAAFEVQVDLAYIELKEFLYSPLTLKLGRQDLWFGKGFIVGANFLDPSSGIGAGSIYPYEYTAITSFDAARATLDYDPWTIDAVFAKIAENSDRSDDDINLYGVNVGYVFDSYNAEAEAYYWMKQSRNLGGTVAGRVIPLVSANGNVENDVHTIGGRGSFDPIEDWTLALESAYQFGQYLNTDAQVTARDRSAWALDASAECRYWQDNFAWKPVLGIEYIYYSGEEYLGDQGAGTVGKYNGWDPMFRGKFDTAIREFQNVYYNTAQASTPSFTNQHQVLVTGSVEPTDSLTASATYGHFWLVEKFSSVLNLSNQDIGDEVDLQLTWDYTEDVQFNLLSAWFFPGDHWSNGQDDVASDIVGTVKLSF